MIESIVNGKETSRIILVEEEDISAGLKVAKVFISSHALLGFPVYVACFDQSWDLFIQGLAEDTLKNLTHLDGFTDPLSWNNSENVFGHNSVTTYDNFLSLKAETFEPESMLVVYSLSSFLLHSPSSREVCMSIYKFVRNTQPKVNKLIMVLPTHEEFKTLMITLEQVASTTVRVKTPVTASSATGVICKTMHSKGNKSVHATEILTLGTNFVIEKIEALASNDQKKSIIPPTAPKPSMNLTFNLNLKEDEKAAREKVVLPYLKRGKDAGETAGTIYYEPEDIFLSDEDPDDDLDV